MKTVLARLSLLCISLMVISLIFTAQSNAKIDPKSIVGIWPFDEGQGNVAKDSSGKGNDGKLMGSPKWVGGKFGSALEFDGAKAYVDIGDNPALAPTTNKLTVVAWVFVKGAGKVSIVENNAKNWGFRFADVPQLTELLKEQCLPVPACLRRRQANGRQAREGAREYWLAALNIASSLKIPLIDYYVEIMRRRPDDWNGALEKFSEYEGYDVPTLISRDGGHPSHPVKYRNDFSEKALNCNGYGLRNYMTLRKYYEVITKVLKEE
jgi:hypothetical protein